MSKKTFNLYDISGINLKDFNKHEYNSWLDSKGKIYYKEKVKSLTLIIDYINYRLNTSTFLNTSKQYYGITIIYNNEYYITESETTLSNVLIQYAKIKEYVKKYL